jgi:hypothetical protein
MTPTEHAKPRGFLPEDFEKKSEWVDSPRRKDLREFDLLKSYLIQSVAFSAIQSSLLMLSINKVFPLHPICKTFVFGASLCAMYYTALYKKMPVLAIHETAYIPIIGVAILINNFVQKLFQPNSDGVAILFFDCIKRSFTGGAI